MSIADLINVVKLNLARTGSVCLLLNFHSVWFGYAKYAIT